MTSIMKKIYFIAFTVLATLALGSCVKEIQDNDSNVILGGNDIAFVMKGGVATRAGEIASVSKGVSVPLGVTEDGTSLYLEETVTQLDAAPITRGTPAYTENLGVLYANQLGVHAVGGSFGDETFETAGQPEKGDGNLAWRYVHQYGSDPWPESETTPVSFYLQMPATINGFTATAEGGATVTTTPNYSGETITFNYTSPATASQMQDILFGYASFSKSEYKKKLPNGYPVTLFHALTGVKFAIGNDDDDISANTISIDTIYFTGLKDKGICTVDVTQDNPKAVATWDNLGTTSANARYGSGKYGAPVTYTEDGSFGDGVGDYPASFVPGGEKNLNDAAATQTFWLIPQEMTDDIKLTITYTFAGKQSTGVLEFGKYLAAANVDWKAGELRTYTIRVEDVNLKIDDKVTPGTDDVVGSYKNDVVITNTGNTEVFIRAAIVGQWRDSGGNIVFGFTDKINQLYLVESWYQDQFVNHKGTHGVFVDLPGYWNQTVANHNTEATAYSNPLHNWEYNSEDGYFYYTKVVAPGKATGTINEAGTFVHDPLFTSYTISKIPNSEIAGAEIDDKTMYFTLEISTQAISARKTDGTVLNDSQYADAWAAAKLGNKLN